MVRAYLIEQIRQGIYEKERNPNYDFFNSDYIWNASTAF